MILIILAKERLKMEIIVFTKLFFIFKENNKFCWEKLTFNFGELNIFMKLI